MMCGSKWVGGAVLAVVMAIWLYLLLWPIPKLPIDAANGVYANPCCQPIILRDGTMSFGKHEVGYSIEHDKGGAYVLPQLYVGVEPSGLQVDQSRYPLKLRLDDMSPPGRLTLPSSNSEDYEFAR
jgi:hypothetical protein